MSAGADTDAVFARADAVVAVARDAGLVIDRHLALAGMAVHLRIVGPRLLPPLDAAFGHRARAPAAAAATADLTLTVLDASLAELPHAAAFAPPYAWGDDLGDGARTLIDAPRGRALSVVADPDAVPDWAHASPLRSLLGAFFATRGTYLVHAAAVGDARGGVLLAGKGGSGKSTCALACLTSERLAIAGDDFVALDPVARRAHALYATAKIGRGEVALFPALADLIAPAPTAKALLHLHPRASSRLADLPLHAVAVPVLALDRAESRFEPLARSAALMALAPWSMALIAGAGDDTFVATSAFVARVPAFRVYVGRDPRLVPPMLEALLAEAGGA